MAFFRSALFQRAAVLGLFGVAALSFGTRSDARPPDRAFGYAVVLEDDEGMPLRTFRQNGTTFVLGYEGDRYEIRLENDTDRRVEAVVTVDGRDAISGAVGDYVRSRGYIVPAHGSIRVDGFRRSMDHTAAFRFSSPSSSYSARMGTPENVGVIGVAFFPERRIVHRPPPRPYWWSREEFRDDRPEPPRRRSHTDAEGDLGTSYGERRPAPAAPAASGASRDKAAAPEASSRSAEAKKSDSPYSRRNDYPRENRLGTEYGESTYSPVTEVSFVRENPSAPSVLLSLRYDDEDGLEARGIDVYPKAHAWSWADAPPSPDPFPRNRFAPPPP